jgi:hypothetical protein
VDESRRLSEGNMNIRVRSSIAATAIALSALAAPVRAQTAAALGVVDGIVTDTGMVSLAGATVSILGSEVRVATGANGRFRIVGLRRGNYILAVHRIGYVPVAMAMAVAEHDTLRPSFALQRITTALDTMIVTAKSVTKRLSEFEGRRRAGVGYFITGDEIERRNSVYIADVIRMVPSVAIDERHMFQQVAISTRDGCRFNIYVDGMPMERGTNLMNLPSPKDFAGIEIYSGPATIPVQYKPMVGNCGVILFWTKRDE